MKNNLLPIAKEGWKYLGYSTVIFFISVFFDIDIFIGLSFIVMIHFIYVFRNPERELSSYEDKSVVSPVDGRITSIEEVNDSKYFYKLIIKSSYSDISLLRTPMDGLVSSQVNFTGSRVNTSHPLSKKINEYTSIEFEDKNLNTIKITHRIKESFCAIQTDTIVGLNFRYGTRYGVMNSGVTEVYLPKNFRLSISLGDEVKASQSLIGFFS